MTDENWDGVINVHLHGGYQVLGRRGPTCVSRSSGAL